MDAGGCRGIWLCYFSNASKSERRSRSLAARTTWIDLPFAELKRRSLIDDRARAADQDPAFSIRIREGLPEMP